MVVSEASSIVGNGKYFLLICMPDGAKVPMRLRVVESVACVSTESSSYLAEIMVSPISLREYA